MLHNGEGRNYSQSYRREENGLQQRISTWEVKHGLRVYLPLFLIYIKQQNSARCLNSLAQHKKQTERMTKAASKIGVAEQKEIELAAPRCRG